MNYSMNQQISALLDGVSKVASETTHGLARLGNGRMADGLIALWKDGQRNGLIRGAVGTSVVFTIGIGGFVLIKNKMAEIQAKQAIKAACQTTTETPAEVATSTDLDPEMEDDAEQRSMEGEQP